MAGIFFSAARFARVLDRWSDGPGPVSTRLLVAIREHIRSGQLPAGARLPSERQVAAALGVARTTVTHAFDNLRTEGLLVSRTGVGTFVSAAGRHVTARGDDRLGSFVHERIDTRIDLRSAALTAIPLVGDVLAGQCAEDFSDTLRTHGYVPAGLPILRSAVANYYEELGLGTAPEQVLVTSGAQQALRLVAQAMIEPGDTVLLEEPTYRGAIEVMRSAGARLLGIPSDSCGIDVGALADAARRHRLKLILLQSTVHNPTGSVLPEEGRAAVAELASRLGVTIVDHLAGMDALIDGPMPRPLAAYGCDVITIGSASKAFWGGLRVGWIRGTSHSVGHFTAVKSAEDLGTSIPAQIATAKLLYRIEEARAYRRRTLGAARALLLNLLTEHLSDWQPLLPAGGASMWVRLPEGYSATATVEKAARAGIDVLPGPTFSSENALDNFIRLAFAAPAETLISGIDGLAAVWQTVRSAHSFAGVHPTAG